ncbi:MAG: hypothetical protein J6P02_05420 [Lachnospiraceae bacterium]|nr:hypothetical protein [Lachnospiraceae bacterium]
MSSIKLENLEINDYMIYQDKDSFNFGIDAVLLANFALREFYALSSKNEKVIKTKEPNKNSSIDSLRICDFCTGSLPIPLVMYAKRKMYLGDRVKIDAFEIDKEQVELCNKSLSYNKENVSDAQNILEDIKVFNEDINNLINDKDKFKHLYESYDMITVNPPYNREGCGIVSLNDKKNVARHEIYITFDKICKASSLLLKSNKKFYIVHHTERFVEIVDTLKSNSFEIKKVQFVHTKIDKPSNLVLIEAVKNGKSGVRVLPPIIVFNNDGQYTQNVQKIYGK